MNTRDRLFIHSFGGRAVGRRVIPLTFLLPSLGVAVATFGICRGYFTIDGEARRKQILQNAIEHNMSPNEYLQYLHERDEKAFRWFKEHSW